VFLLAIKIGQIQVNVLLIGVKMSIIINVFLEKIQLNVMENLGNLTVPMTTHYIVKIFQEH
jgi:hypothetical protein